jgi:hypothetical protein
LVLVTPFKVDYIRAVHGTTAFADSEQLRAGTQSTRRTPYFWWTVWTAVSGEDVNIQYRGNPNSAPTASLDFIILIAINLSDDVTENTDWVYAERTTDDALTTTPLAGASITFTPGSASDWLVLTNGQYTMCADTISYISKMETSGEASSSLAEARREMIAAGEATRFNVVSLARVFALGAASNTFAEYGSESAVEVTRTHSRVFALNLDKFRNHAFAYTEADVSLSATNYATLLQTLSITPDVTGDVWVAGYFGFDVGNVARIVEYRIQRDNADEPAG